MQRGPAEVFFTVLQRFTGAILFFDITIQLFNVSFSLFGTLAFSFRAFAFGFRAFTLSFGALALGLFRLGGGRAYVFQIFAVGKVDDQDDRNRYQQRVESDGIERTEDRARGCGAAKVGD